MALDRANLTRIAGIERIEGPVQFFPTIGAPAGNERAEIRTPGLRTHTTAPWCIAHAEP